MENLLVQVYYTKNGENMKAGFSSFQDMVGFWRIALKKHCELFDRICIYTDYEGSIAFKKAGLLMNNKIKVIVIAFDIPDRRFWNACKFTAHLHQPQLYFMCDIDFMLYDLPSFETDVICEFIRGSRSNEYYPSFNIPERYVWLPASGFLGFNDVGFARRYAAEALEKIRAASIDKVDYSTLYTIEEAFLAKKIDEEKKTLSELNVSYVHLRGNMKR